TQDLRLEQVLDADSQPRRLVGVGRADPALVRADLQRAEPPLAALMDRDVPRHDQVRLAADTDAAGVDPAGFEPVELADEHLGVDHAAGAEEALLAVQDPRRHVVELVLLAAGDDRVPGVRAALVAADEVGVLRQQVDDLALAFVPPLRADNHGRGHQASPGAQWISPGRTSEARASSRRRPSSGRLGAPTITVAGTRRSLP